MKKLYSLFALIGIFLSACGAPAATATTAPVVIPPTDALPTAIPPTATLEPCDADQVHFESINNSNEEITFFWVNFDNNEESYGTVKSGERFDSCTFETHIWVARNTQGEFVMAYTVNADAIQRVDVSQEMADNAGVEVISEQEIAMKEMVQKFVDEGHIPSTDGEFLSLGDYSADNAGLTYYGQYTADDFEAGNFVYNGHFKWSNAEETTRAAGCGLIFAGQLNNGEISHHYGIFLSAKQIFFIGSEPEAGNLKSVELGKQSGTGKVDFGNPAEADFTLVVYEKNAYVYVDGNFIGGYGLAEQWPTDGKLTYSMISGTTKDYGTRCEITNSSLWMLQ